MNCVILSGEIQTLKKVETANGFQARFVLSVPYTYPTGKTYFNKIVCVAFGSIAEYMTEKLGVGSMLNVQGRWQVTSFKNKDGWSTSNTCMIEHLEVLKSSNPEEELPEGVNDYSIDGNDDNYELSDADLDGII